TFNKILFLLPLIIIVTGFIQDRFIKVKRYEIKNERIKKPLKIGFISDLHLGLTKDKKKIEKIVEILEREKIDLLLAGGDLLDSSYHKDNIKVLKDFNPPYGKFAVFGNHEWYVGLEKSKEIVEGLGFKILSFEFVEIEENIIIAGAEDETARYFKKQWDEKGFLEKLPEDKFIIYLRHRPPKEKLEKVNLCLSGHTHSGQFFPFSIITYFTFKYHSGFYKVDENFSIYVSKGAGTWGPPVRFLSTRDIAIFYLN
ncbi:MAG: metallophosphoesterase, partial [Thermoanaerobaculia bacterium]